MIFMCTQFVSSQKTSIKEKINEKKKGNVSQTKSVTVEVNPTETLV